MAFLALAIFIAITVFAYFHGRKDLLSPWFLLCLSILGAYSLVLLNYENWQVVIYPKFVVYVTTALIMFGLGCAVVRARKAAVLKKASKRLPIDDVLPSEPTHYPAKLVAIVSFVLTAIYCARMLSFASGVSGFMNKLRYVYESKMPAGFIFNQAMEISVMLAYVSAFKLMQSIFSHKDKTNKFLLVIPIILASVLCMIQTDRNRFIQLALFVILIYAMFYIENTKKKNRKGLILQILIMGLVVVVLFYLFGKVKNYKSDIGRSIGIYAGSGLYNFNLWLEDFSGPLHYGGATFYVSMDIFEYMFSLVGANVELSYNVPIVEYITYISPNGYVFSSNIYSALRSYVEDFGYFGVIFVPFCFGMLHQWLYAKAKEKKYSIWSILYCFMVHPLICIPILERYFTISFVGFTYQIFWVSVLYYVLIGKNERKLSRNKISAKTTSQDKQSRETAMSVKKSRKT